MQERTPDELLIKRAQKGDPEAFEALLSAHESNIYAVALRMMGNREDAQDCAQDAMLRIYKSINAFRGQSSFATWVYRLTMNICLDELRRRKVRHSTSLDDLVEEGWTPADPGESPEAQTIRTERSDALQAAIQTLPEEMRACIILRDIKGYSYEEIADILNANIGTVKSRISRGRDRLREIISAQPELFGL